MGQITVTHHDGYVEYYFDGSFDDENLYQSCSDLWTADDYPPTKPELHDLRVADFSQITATGIRKVTKLNRQLLSNAPKLPNAMLANNQFTNFYSRMASRLRAEWNPNVRVFQDYEEAVEWVSLEGARTS